VDLPAARYVGGYSIAIADMNGDGDPDVITTGSVLLGNGDGTFQPEKDFATGRTPVAIAIGDVNADGNLDVAMADHDGGAISILLGRGDGTFGSSTDYETGPPSSVVL